MMDDEARGYNDSNRYVCAECVEEDYLSDFINEFGPAREDGKEVECSYCGQLPTVPLETVLRLIVNGLKTEYDMPENGVAWESAEGGWIGATVWDTWDLLQQFGIGDQPLADIVNAILIEAWSDKNPYALREHQELYLGWERFSAMIKHETRFVFFRLSNRDETKYYDQPAYGLYGILDKLGDISLKLNLFKTIKEGTSIFRARPTTSDTPYSGLSSLGPPPPERAKFSNRMSPAGISLFYGAMQPDTCLKEIRQDEQENQRATLAEWKVCRDLIMLDLTAIPDLPSIFDGDNNSKRASIKFLRDFLVDFQKPIEKDGREHIEYVPTQVVTEYFRRLFEFEEGTRLDGIIYPSSKDGLESCVFFCGPEGCCEYGSPDSGGKMLGLVPGSSRLVGD